MESWISILYWELQWKEDHVLQTRCLVYRRTNFSSPHSGGRLESSSPRLLNDLSLTVLISCEEHLTKSFGVLVKGGCGGLLAAASSGRFFLRSRKGGDLHRKLVGKFLKLSSGYKSIMIYLIINFVGIEPVSLSRLAFFSHDSEPVPHVFIDLLVRSKELLLWWIRSPRLPCLF